MKRILFSCCIAIMPFAVSFAQNSNAANPSISDKAMFSSHVNELDAYLGRKNETKAQSIFAGLKTDMEHHLNDSKNALRDTPDADKATARKKYDVKQKSYLEILDLSKDLAGNRKAVHEKLEEYYNNY